MGKKQTKLQATWREMFEAAGTVLTCLWVLCIGYAQLFVQLYYNWKNSQQNEDIKKLVQVAWKDYTIQNDDGVRIKEIIAKLTLAPKKTEVQVEMSDYEWILGYAERKSCVLPEEWYYSENTGPMFLWGEDKEVAFSIWQINLCNAEIDLYATRASDDSVCMVQLGLFKVVPTVGVNKTVTDANARTQRKKEEAAKLIRAQEQEQAERLKAAKANKKSWWHRLRGSASKK